MHLKIVAMSLLSSIAIGACSVIGIRSGTEEPHYSLLDTQGPLEIRQYAARLAAETEVTGTEYSARGDGFRRLARYIFGANSGQAGIAMTAPVAQASRQIAMTAPVEQEPGQDQPAPGTWRIRFFMPAQYTEATLPRPDDPAVKIVTVPAQTYGVYRYTGSTGPAATAAAGLELRQRLQTTGWTPSGQTAAWFYDPPWTLPFLRRNEAAIPVAKPPG